MSSLLKPARLRDPIDLCNHQSSNLRSYLKGVGANLGREARLQKADILAQIQELDRVSDSSGLDDDGWAWRYHLEDQLMHLLASEEEY